MKHEQLFQFKCASLAKKHHRLEHLTEKIMDQSAKNNNKTKKSSKEITCLVKQKKRG